MRVGASPISVATDYMGRLWVAIKLHREEKSLQSSMLCSAPSAASIS